MNLSEPLKVYVPAPQGFLSHLTRGAGIVGSPHGEGKVLVDYDDEVGRFSNIITYGDRVYNAADRHQPRYGDGMRYPTSHRSVVPESHLVEVGTFDGTRVTVTNINALAEWLGVTITPAELEREGTKPAPSTAEIVEAIKRGDFSGLL